jgi:phage shock protein PspC (stress-responsive transcriptional regulator)
MVTPACEADDDPMNTTDAPRSETRPSEASPRRLVRLPDEGPGFGVAAGLGAYLGLDPMIVRIVFVVLALAGGSGVVLYLLGWLLIPAAEPGEVVDRAGHPSGDQTTQWVGIALIVFAALWLSGQIGTFSGPALWGLALIALGVVLFREDAQKRGGTAAGRPLGPPSPPRVPGQAPTEPAAAWGPPAAAKPDRPPSLLGRITWGVMLIAAGALAMADTAGILAPSPSDYVAVLLTVVGAALLVGTWLGRARGLIVVGLLLIPLLLVSSLLDGRVSLRGGVGERSWTPQTVDQLDDTYELFAGEARLDLTQVDLRRQTVEVAARVTLGQLTVVLPEEAAVEVSGRAAAGQLELLGQRVRGTTLDQTVADPGREGAGRIVLDVDTAFGEVLVLRDASARGPEAQ